MAAQSAHILAYNIRWNEFCVLPFVQDASFVSWNYGMRYDRFSIIYKRIKMGVIQAYQLKVQLLLVAYFFDETVFLRSAINQCVLLV